MTETSYERGYRQGQEGKPPVTSKTGGSFLTKPLGPAPVWAWLIGAAVLAVLVYLWRKNQASATATPSTTDTSQIPEFVNQVYTNPSPPSDVTVNNEPPENNPPGIYPGPPIRPPGPQPKPIIRDIPPGYKAPPIFNGIYEVKKGDTLAKVAKMFSISRVELAHANGLGTGAGLRTGQKLRVPKPPPQGVPNKAE